MGWGNIQNNSKIPIFFTVTKGLQGKKKHQKTHVFLLLFTTRFSLEPFSLKLVGCTVQVAKCRVKDFNFRVLKTKNWSHKGTCLVGCYWRYVNLLMVWVVVDGEVHSTSTSQLKTWAPCCNCRLRVLHTVRPTTIAWMSSPKSTNWCAFRYLKLTWIGTPSAQFPWSACGCVADVAVCAAVMPSRKTSMLSLRYTGLRVVQKRYIYK